MSPSHDTAHQPEPAPRPDSEEARALSRLGIRELRTQLTSLVRRAGAGERVVVTIGGRPVAQLGPVEPSDARVTLDDLIARGLVEPARRGDRPRPDTGIDSWTGGRLDKALREVRGA